MERAQSPVVRALMRVNLGCAVLSGVALLMMMIVGALDVIGTNLDIIGLTSLPLPAAFEFMAAMMVVNVFLALALGQARRAHIQVGILVNRLPRPLRRLTDILSHGCSLLFFTLIAWYGWASGIRSFSVGEYESGLINFPIWPARLVLAVGATLMVVQCLFDVLGAIWRRLSVEGYESQADQRRPVD